MTDLPKDPHQAREINFGRALLGLPEIDYNELAETPLPKLRSRHEHFELEVQKTKDVMEDFRIDHPDYMYHPHYASYIELERKLRDLQQHTDKYAAEIARREELSLLPVADSGVPEEALAKKKTRQSTKDANEVRNQAIEELGKSEKKPRLTDLACIVHDREPGKNYGIRQVTKWIRKLHPDYTPGQRGRKKKK
jgi:hypothetical protein